MKFWKWLAGHWVWLITCLAVLVVAALVFLGRVTPESAAAIAILLVGCFVADFRPQLERHQAEIVGVFHEVLMAGQAAQAHNLQAVLVAGEAAAQDGAALASEVEKENPKS